MKLPCNKEHIKLYKRLGLAYLFLWLFFDLITNTSLFHKYALNEIWRAVYMVFVNYLFYEYTLPQLNTKKILRSFLLIVGQIFLFAYGAYAWRHIGIQLGIHTPFQTFDSIPDDISNQFSDSVFAVFFFGILRHIYYYRKLKEAAQQLRIEKQEAELNYLKSQTNPHFLFNTLNNIYALARDKSDLAPESILRLSKILRFMLYETSGTFICIEQELKIINDYIALEKLRYDESLQINFNYDVEDMKQALPPLLLIPLVENAFKHGVSETRTYPFIHIHLSIKGRILTLSIKNSTDAFPEERHVKENIGLSNLRRQLQLLYSDFNLSVQQGESVFTAFLKINLATHV
jgi:sensor histidine kinase YesM